MSRDRRGRGRSRSPVSTRDRRRRQPRQRRQNSGRERTEGLENMVRRAMEFGVRHFGPSAQPARDDGPSGCGSSGAQRHCQSRDIDSKDLTKVILGQVIKYVVHRYFVSRMHAHSGEGAGGHHHHHHHAATPHASGGGGGGGGATAPSETRIHPEPRGQGATTPPELDEVLYGLDDLLHHLQSTEDLVQRTMYGPASHENCSLHRDVLVNASTLQASIGNASVRVRRVRDALQQQQPAHGDRGSGSAREDRRGGARSYHAGLS